MAKQQSSQRLILKLHSERLRTSRWNLVLPLSEAKRNEELISLADSQIIRWIDELNHAQNCEWQIQNIKRKIREVKSDSQNVILARAQMRDLYSQMEKLQYRPDYISLIIDRKSDYRRACKGFSINGIRYKRLLGTNGGIKNSTIVFVSERLLEPLVSRIENGRDMTVPLVTAKLEAYKALVCSASIPVSMPKGILVVDDCVTRFKDHVTYLTDEGDTCEPLMMDIRDYEVELNISDGCGMMLPSLAQRWSEELGLDYIVSGLNTRYSFEKGMVFTFDFLAFAQEKVGSYIVRDAWGDAVDIRNVELVLTTSMVKLWNCYESCEAYLSASRSNHYEFAVTKTCPKTLEKQRYLNYQFIQSYDLDDDDIEELCSLTINEIRDVLSGDWRKTVLFLKGIGLTENNIDKQADDAAKAIMIDNRMMNDPYVQSYIWKLIQNRVDEAKTGQLKVHGNYSICCGDLYALCQHMFNLPVTGLLKRSEIYNEYWKGIESVVCFRAPMTSMCNIVRHSPADNEEVSFWFRYMNTCTVFNAWDTSMQKLNGMDFDGDMVMLSDDPVLLRKHVEQPALICAQRKAEKRISDEADFVKSNIDSFGNDIGRTTNWITSMFEVQSRFERHSREYKELDYRIKCGQLYQQNAID